MRKYLLTVLLAAGVIFVNAQGNFESNSTTGNWTDAASWTLISGSDPDGIPDANDNVSILAGHTRTMNASRSIFDLTISTGTATIDGTANLTIYNSLSIAGGSTFNCTGTGKINVTATGSINTTGSGIATISGRDITTAGAAPTVISLFSATPTISGTCTLSVGTSAIIINNNETLTLNTSCIANVYNLMGNSTLSINSASTGTSAIQESGSTISVSTGNSLTLSGSLALQNSPTANSFADITGAGTITASSLIIGNTAATNGAATRTMTFNSSINAANITGDVTINSFISPALDRIINGVLSITSGSFDVNGTVSTVNQHASNQSVITLANSPATGTFILSAATPFSFSGIGTNLTTFNGSGSTVVYDFAGAQAAHITTYTNMTLAGSGSKTVTGTIVQGIHTLQGTATATGTTPTYGGDATIQYLGSATQTTNIELPFGFNGTGGIIINNPYDVNLGSSNVLASNCKLTLTSGDFVLGSNNLVMLNSSTSAIVGGSTSSYITTDGTGTFQRQVASTGTYHFPVGSNSNYELASLTLNSITGTSSIKVNFTTTVPAAPIGVTIQGILIDDFLNAGQWIITPDIALSGGSFDLTLNSRGHTNAAAFLDYHGILKSTGSSWVEPGTHVYPPNTPLSGSDPVSVSATTITSFSSFNFAIGFSTSSALPIVLTEFDGSNVGSANILNWTTASEINNDFFTIERSLDGQTYEDIGIVDGAGQSSQVLDYTFVDDQPFLGTNYYRLKQTDFNGDFEYSDVISLLVDGNFEMSYPCPNPVINNVCFNINSEFGGQAYLRVLDMNGRLVYDNRIVANGGMQTITVNMENLAAGMYVSEITIDGVQYRKTIMKQ